MDGILPLWKPKGMTSHDCVYAIRRLLKMKKVGHTGTLDPAVEGVLPICLGQATKISSIIMESQKVYEAEVTLGVSTETEDQEGAVVEVKKLTEPLTMAEVERALQGFIGEMEQIPPMYSAVKVKGKKLYEYARSGEEVERPVRKVHIHSITLLSEVKTLEEGTATFRIRVACSKGTYIRTLCVDIGKELGFPAHMSQLVRIESGTFQQEDAVTFEEIQEAVEKGTVERMVKNLDQALTKYDQIVVSKEDELRIRNGQVLPLPKEECKTNPFRMKTSDGKLLALYQIHPTKPHVMKPFKMFVVK
ncbi:tRNA pseudouridine(55) synthase TruB [Salirhabdus sp. Marseille-P4669]|uniref:tRNA pseudouridine(55) synthase TruB n=1 Tax=Salirhabdus sp. Marseille-P4669 TaxID=2042310 RepID=UPI000C7B93AD|nr:tRNA pseudouridine(55) synthase TruB [Salirhabdus sp. Marseille-P4669]